LPYEEVPNDLAGITVYGYDRYVSYGYPAGMSLKTLAGGE
jgi:hypothetical protein